MRKGESYVAVREMITDDAPAGDKAGDWGTSCCARWGQWLRRSAHQDMRAGFCEKQKSYDCEMQPMQTGGLHSYCSVAQYIGIPMFRCGAPDPSEERGDL